MTDPIQSSLASGGIVNIDGMDFEQASGEKADWSELCGQLERVSVETMGKVWYQLSMRGKQEKTARKGLRMGYGGTGSFGKEQVFISFPNAASSIKAGEFTSSRFQAVVSGKIDFWLKDHNYVPAIGGVVGGSELASGWETVSDKLKASWESQDRKSEVRELAIKKDLQLASCSYREAWDKIGIVLGGGPAQSAEDTKRNEYLKDFPIGTSKNEKNARSQTVLRGDAMFAVMGSPSQPPLVVEYGIGMLELGLMHAGMADFRARIKATMKPGVTTDEMDRAKTSFASNYARRGAQRGGISDQKTLVEIYSATKSAWLEGMNLGAAGVDGMDDIWRNFFDEAKKKHGFTGPFVPM